MGKHGGYASSGGGGYTGGNGGGSGSYTINYTISSN